MAEHEDEAHPPVLEAADPPVLEATDPPVLEAAEKERTEDNEAVKGAGVPTTTTTKSAKKVSDFIGVNEGCKEYLCSQQPPSVAAYESVHT